MARRRYRKRGGVPFYPIVVIVLICIGGYLGCDPNSTAELIPGGPATTASSNPQYTQYIPDRSEAKILIGSFNIRRFGPSNRTDPWVMERLANVLSRFDVIAIQEITDIEQKALPALVNLINQSGARYSYTMSPRIGREESGYYEQYAFVFDTTRVQSSPSVSYVVQDERDIMHREPFVGRFVTTDSTQPFCFTLINVHTDPDEIEYELDVLADVYKNVRQFEYPEDDVMIVGDLNQQPGKLQQLEQIPGFVPLIVGMPTNTRKSKTLDNILVDKQTTVEFSGRAGVLDLEQVFEISEAEVLRLSDHLPVWAEFSFREQAGRTAAISGGATIR